MRKDRTKLQINRQLRRRPLLDQIRPHVASIGEQGFRRFTSLCQDQKAACDAAFRFGALVGADAAMRCAPAGDRIACFKKTMNSQEFMEEERKAITGQTDPKE
jgi:hypothetical protein